MASLASLLGPSIQIPQSNFSWLDSAFDNIGGAMQRGQQNKSFNKLADLIGQPQQGQQMQQPAMGGVQQEQAYTAPVMPVERGPVQKGSTYQPFMDTVRAGGVTNPFALSAIAATGRAESGWSADKAGSTWSDPSESGQAGTSGGVMSWRGPRYQAMAAGGDLSPEAQARFFLQEDPQLIQALQASKSPEEAQRLMNNAWKFAGYDRPGGEAARRMALAQNYYAQEYGKAGQVPEGGAAAAIEDIAPAGGFDDGRFADVVMPAQGRDQLATALQQGNMDATTQTENASAAPVQVADASGGLPTSTAISGASAQGVTPIQRGGVSPEIIQMMIRDPNLRDMGLKLWQQSVTGSTGEPWQFVQGPDGTLLRANQQTGEITPIGNFAKPQNDKAPQIVELFDEQTGQPYKARYNPQTMEYERVGGVKAPTGMQITTNPDGTVSVTQGPQGKTPKLTEQQSKDLVYYRRGSGALETLDPIAEELTSGLGAIADNVPFGNYAKSNTYQKAKQAGLEFLQAILRKDTGAAITKQEQEEYGKVYLPQPGDGAELLLQKKQARSRALEAIRKGLGPAEILAGERPRDGATGDVPSAAVRAVNPQTGEVIELQNGQWVPVQ